MTKRCPVCMAKPALPVVLIRGARYGLRGVRVCCVELFMLFVEDVEVLVVVVISGRCKKVRGGYVLLSFPVIFESLHVNLAGRLSHFVVCMPIAEFVS